MEELINILRDDDSNVSRETINSDTLDNQLIEQITSYS